MTYLAFFMGLLGSLHCAVMCGPLMLALPDQGKPPLALLFHRLLYQAGRILTYGFLGLLAGLISSGSVMKGWQQQISIFTGILLLVMGIYHLVGRHIPAIAQRQQTLVAPLLSRMGYWLYRPGGNFMAGMLNGLLPCGMVYLALASALSTGSLLNGAQFMLLFGLGTLPLMLIAGIAGSFIKNKLRLRFNTWLPMLFLVMGCWFVLRGANLDIPFLSPLLYPEGAIHCKP